MLFDLRKKIMLMIKDMSELVQRQTLSGHVQWKWSHQTEKWKDALLVGLVRSKLF